GVPTFRVGAALDHGRVTQEERATFDGVSYAVSSDGKRQNDHGRGDPRKFLLVPPAQQQVVHWNEQDDVGYQEEADEAEARRFGRLHARERIGETAESAAPPGISAALEHVGGAQVALPDLEKLFPHGRLALPCPEI